MTGMMQGLEAVSAKTINRQVPRGGLDEARSAAAQSSPGPAQAATAEPTAAAGPSLCPPERGLLMDHIMPAGAEPMATSPPPDSVVERIHLVFNNVSMQNLEQKAGETRGVLEHEFLPWFGNYLVVKRISTQPNFHQLYLAFILKLEAPELLKSVLASVFHNVSKLLASPKITTSTSERSLLKNLGSWLGQMTLARNKPILQRKLDVKELLCQGYETGRLIAVTPFVAKIMEGAKDCRVFRPPNPWIMCLMGILRELYDLEDLKMNIKFEIEVLCKHLGLKIDDVPPQRILCHRLQPRKDKTPDFNVRQAPPSSQANELPSGKAHPPTMPVAQEGASAGASGLAEHGSGMDAASAGGTAVPIGGEQTVIPNLGAYVTVNQQLSMFQQHPQLKSVVPIAVDRAIREIIQVPAKKLSRVENLCLMHLPPRTRIVVRKSSFTFHFSPVTPPLFFVVPQNSPWSSDP